MNKVKLFCISHAGGSAMMYNRWREYLNSAIELYPLEMAGRGKRRCEMFYENFQQALDDILNCIKNEINDVDYALFGHSMGSWIAYELYFEIVRLNYKKPIHIFFSGNRAPYTDQNEMIYHTLDDSDFKSEIKKIGGIPKELFSNKELFDLFLPVLRSDFKLIEKYEHTKKKYKIDCNVSVLCGKSDFKVSSSELIKWKRCTGVKCDIYKLEGGHFYIFENIKNTVNVINKVLLENFIYSF